MHYDSDINFRPPFEEKSLLIQATKGCSHNDCTFCAMYRNKQFAISPFEEIKEDIDSVAKNRTLFKRVFLLGGDPFALSYERLKQIGEYIHEKLPRIETIGCYATIGNVLAKTPEQLHELAQLGFDDLNIGVESGSDEVLAFMNKGYTVKEAEKALLMLNDAGISYTVNLIIGAAGHGHAKEHALTCATLINKVQPHLIMVDPVRPDPSAPLTKMIEDGEFTLPTLKEIIEEEIEFIRACELEDTLFFGMYHDNPVRVNGVLNKDKEFLIEGLEAGLNRFPNYQLAEPIRRI